MLLNGTVCEAVGKLPAPVAVSVQYIIVYYIVLYDVILRIYYYIIAYYTTIIHTTILVQERKAMHPIRWMLVEAEQHVNARRAAVDRSRKTLSDLRAQREKLTQEIADEPK